MIRQVTDREWIPVNRRIGFRIVCCECGLGHLVHMRTRAGSLQLQFIREPKATTIRKVPPVPVMPQCPNCDAEESVEEFALEWFYCSVCSARFLIIGGVLRKVIRNR